MMSLLGKIGMLLGKFDAVPGFGEGETYGWISNIWEVLIPLLYAIMAIVAAAGAIYAIVLGVNLAKAEDQSKRDEAKKRLITTLIAVAVTIVLCLFFTELLPLILKATLKTA